MKLTILAVAATALVAVPALHAQVVTPPQASITGHNRAPHRGGMWSQLNFSADQQAKMTAIRAKYAPQMKAAREKAKPEFDALKAARTSKDTAAMRAARTKLGAAMAPSQGLMKQQMAEMRSVLTPEQQQKADSASARMKGRMGGRGGWGRGMGMHPGSKQPAPPVKPAGAL